MHAYIVACMHLFMRTSLHACMHACEVASMHACAAAAPLKIRREHFSTDSPNSSALYLLPCYKEFTTTYINGSVERQLFNSINRRFIYIQVYVPLINDKYALQLPSAFRPWCHCCVQCSALKCTVSRAYMYMSAAKGKENDAAVINYCEIGRRKKPLNSLS